MGYLHLILDDILKLLQLEIEFHYLSQDYFGLTLASFLLQHPTTKTAVQIPVEI